MTEVKDISSDDLKERLAYLIKRIDNGFADAEEYEEFEKILHDNGIDDNKIRKPLTSTKATEWEDFAKKRKEVKSSDDFDKKNQYEAVLIGALIGLGLYLLYRVLGKKD